MAVVVWFGVVRHDDAIVEWQRQVAGSRRAPATERRGQRFSRALGLPVVATGAALLAMLPQVQVGPALAAPQTDSAQVLALGPVGYDVGLTDDDRVLVPHDERGRVVADGDTQDVRDAWNAPGIDPAAAAADVAGLLGQDAADPGGVTGPTGAVGADGIPTTVLAAYQSAASTMARLQPSCHLPWWLLAGIGRIESGHASGGRVTADGTTRGRILGPRLDGSWSGTSVILDSDGGALDGDPAYDRAVGPMQFLPGTWRSWGRDGNGDGVADPDNVFDAALGAGAYLCAGGRDLATDAGIAAAVLSYNYSQSYLQSVVTWGLAYRDGVTPTQDASGDVPAPPRSPSPPPGPSAGSGTPSPGTSSSSSTSSTSSSSTTPPSGTSTSTSSSTSSTSTSSTSSTTSTTSNPPSTSTTTSTPSTTTSCPTATTTPATTTTTTPTTPVTTTSTTTGPTSGCPTDPAATPSTTSTTSTPSTTSTTSTTSTSTTSTGTATGTSTGTPSGAGTGTSAPAPSASGRS